MIKMSYFIRPFLAVFLKGDRYQDPIDGTGFRKFLPYGHEKSRENVLSPSTLSLERHRLLWLFLKRETNFFADPLKVLHFAPEQAFFKRFKKLNNIQYITTDLNSPLAQVKADICELPFENDEFDVILCNHVLEHIEDDEKAISELYRVMKPGGWGIFQVPLDNSRSVSFEDPTIVDKKERARIFGQYDHVRIYGMDYFTKLERHGFKVTPRDYTAELDPKDVDRFRLAQGELIPFVQKV